jgi:S1-C subfamily serine protease
MRLSHKKFCWLILTIPLLATSIARAAVEDSVVKIVNQYSQFSWYTPWESGSTGKGTGSGFVISGNRILTNAHVVSDSALLLVYFYNDPTPYPARVVSIGHDCDLAVLELKDPARLETVPALDFDGLPELRSRVVTYGYPTGGQLISSTVGVVSRIECQSYVHAGIAQYLAVQTDAAINPGNSGGPVLQNGKVVGVAFQGNSKLENMGFFIPIQIIDHFITDIKDETYDGFPLAGLYSTNLENPAARAYAAMAPGETGVRLENIMRGSCAENVFHKNDIITVFDGYSVANDGTVNWNGLRLSFDFLPDLKQVGETISAEIIRDGQHMTLEMELTNSNLTRHRAKLYDIKPKYYIYAGLVFAPLNREVLETYSDQWIVDVPQDLVYETYYRPLIENDYMDTDWVIQIRRLDHEVNAEESGFLYTIVESVNGVPVHTLEDLANAFEENTADQHVIRFQQGHCATFLDRRKADAAHQEILDQYAIPKDRCL